MTTYHYIVIAITIFALYELLFFYLIRPYYLTKLAGADDKTMKIPDVAFEVVFLLIIVLGIALAPIVDVGPYLFWGIALLAYGLALKLGKNSFYLASALIFKMHRNLTIEQQLQYQENIILGICLVGGIAFIGVSYLV